MVRQDLSFERLSDSPDEPPAFLPLQMALRGKPLMPEEILFNKFLPVILKLMDCRVEIILDLYHSHAVSSLVQILEE